MSTPHNPLASVAAAAPQPEPSTCVSAAQLAANRENARHSTGPRTPAGKASASLNAVKTALTGRTVLLSTDDAEAYQQHVLAYTQDLQPVGRQESDLVQSIADSSWRLQRIPTLEAALYAKGRLQFADMDFAARFDGQDSARVQSMIELETYLAYEKQFRGLATQEARLHRRREKDLAELRELQKQRKQERNNALEAASRLQMQAKRANQPFDLAQFGFEFSIDDLTAYTDGDRVSQITRAALKHAAQSATITQSAA